MNKYSFPAALALAASSTASLAADWHLNYVGQNLNYVLGTPSLFPQLIAVDLIITTEDSLSMSTAATSLGEGYRITGFTGTRGGFTTYGFTPVEPLLNSSDPLFALGLDNYIYPDTPQKISEGGIGYRTDSGTFNLYGFTTIFFGLDVRHIEHSMQIGPNTVSMEEVVYLPFSFSFERLPAANVPEPTIYALMLVGLGLVGARVRDRRGRHEPPRDSWRPVGVSQADRADSVS